MALQITPEPKPSIHAGQRSRAAGNGLKVDKLGLEEPAIHDYGEDYWSDRSYGALDLEGHVWWITQRLRSPIGR